MKIPLYNQQSGAATRTGKAMQDPGMAQKPGLEIAKAGQVIGDFAKGVSQAIAEYGARRADLKEKADVAEYSLSIKDLQEQIAAEKHDGLIRNKFSYRDTTEKVLDPAIARFEEKLLSQNPKVRQRWELDKKAIYEGEADSIRKMETAEHVGLVRSNADQLIMEGRIEEADAIYSGLAGIVGVHKAEEFKSGGLYSYYNLATQKLKARVYNFEVTPEESLDELKMLEKEVKESGMLPVHKRTTLNVIEAQKTAIPARAYNTGLQASKSFKKAVLNGDADDEMFKVHAEQTGEIQRKADIAWMNERANTQSITDEDMRNALSLIKRATEGDKTLPPSEVIRGLEKISGNTSIYLQLFAYHLEDFKSEGKEVMGYEVGYRNKPIPSGGKTDILMNKIGALIRNGGDAGTVNNAIRSYIKLMDVNSSMPDDEWEEKTNEILRPVAEMAIYKLNKTKYDIYDLTSPYSPASVMSEAQGTERKYEFKSVEEAIAENLPKGTIVYINGRKARVD